MLALFPLSNNTRGLHRVTHNTFFVLELARHVHTRCIIMIRIIPPSRCLRDNLLNCPLICWMRRSFLLLYCATRLCLFLHFRSRSPWLFSSNCLFFCLWRSGSLFFHTRLFTT